MTEVRNVIRTGKQGKSRQATPWNLAQPGQATGFTKISEFKHKAKARTSLSCNELVRHSSLLNW